MISVFDHPWLSGLFGDEEAASLWSTDAQLSHMLAFEAAWTRALAATNRLDARSAEHTAMAISLHRTDISDLANGAAQDGLPIPALIRQLKRGANNPAEIHTGTTSQDVLDTALAITLRGVTDLIQTRLANLDSELRRLEDTYGANVLMGRTRMQAAMPITVADRVRTWRLPILDHKKRFDVLRLRTERVQIGGAAGDRAALGKDGMAIAAHVAQELDLGNPAFAWHAMRDGLVEYSGTLSLTTGTLGKMGQDICLMAQQGIDEIVLSGGGGSSAMPHKQNPVLAELLVTLARFNAVQVSGMHQSLVHEQERSGAAWALEWMLLPQMCLATCRSLAAAINLCKGITRIGMEGNEG
jgi:3-carboxy-cis,cis-muconate cycloisomerase